MKTAIIVISEASISMAKTLKQELPESEIFSTIANADCRHIPALQEAVPQLFRDSDALIFIGAMGICVRAIAPCIEDKKTDPAVLCVDSTGRYVISVLSGHVGGANGLTQYVAGILGAEPVITTRSDRTLGTRHPRKEIRLAGNPRRKLRHEPPDLPFRRLCTDCPVTRYS